MQKTRLTERREIRKERIAAEARRVLEQEGVGALSMRELAASLGVTPASIYFYYPSKEALVREVCDQLYREIAEAQQGLRTIKDPRKRLREICLHYVRQAKLNPGKFKLLFMEPAVEDLPSDSSLKKGDAQEDPYAVFREAVAETISEAKRRKASRAELDSLCQVVWSAGHGAACLSLSFAGDPWFEFGDPEAVFQKAFNLIFEGFISKERKKK